MTDNNDPPDTLSALRLKIKNEEVLQTLEIDVPMKVGRDSAGSVIIDCPCIQVEGIDVAGIARFRLTPTAAKVLFQILTEMHSNSDAQQLPETPRFTH